MAQTYTLEEAAQRLGLPADVFKRKLKDEFQSIRSFRDGPTLRFRAADIDELARTLGEASDPGLQLGAPGATPQTGSSDEFLLDGGTPTEEGPDIFSFNSPKSPGDSDVRLEKADKPASDGDNSPTDEFALDLSGPPSGRQRTGSSSARLVAPTSGPNLAGPESAKIPIPKPKAPDSANTDSSSEFELSLDADSGSFELELNDSSEEVALGANPTPRNAPSGI
ncbi:MAG: hypothetical protein ACRCZF_22975, partial [Gemmataceae bacterium]